MAKDWNNDVTILFNTRTQVSAPSCTWPLSFVGIYREIYKSVIEFLILLPSSCGHWWTAEIKFLRWNKQKCYVLLYSPVYMQKLKRQLQRNKSDWWTVSTLLVRCKQDESRWTDQRKGSWSHILVLFNACLKPRFWQVGLRSWNSLRSFRSQATLSSSARVFLYFW